ncbi:peptidoglycan-binding domain-containing protein [Actinophytocola sp.]|uniref:peptidoglycan-binding domain-containing protein n=1 Tax=Actinophytocola sp. TaxID=1872138 RepID=UPI002D22F14C|nr:peptidoglycan-binding domain-containing protein [Actinophytocola sp.]HYQ62002.1 peptidoglycan-binding domain-containing protein [Actinophytocola sp.]
MIRRFLVAVLGLVSAAGTVLATAPAATADVTAAATPTCTSWSTAYAPYTTDYVLHIPTAGYQTYNDNCILEQGNNNDAVKVLQRALRYCSGYNLSIDGDYGPQTRGAVLDLQRRMNDSYNAGLEEDGEYGPNTYNWVKFPAWSWPANVMQNSCWHSTIG